jgi:hypothetical protein
VIADTNVDIRTAQNTTIRSGIASAFWSNAGTSIKGLTIQLNGGNTPLAMVGSQLQVTVNGVTGIGQIITGSPTVLGN